MITKRLFKSVYLIFVGSVFLSACDSALSDVELEDPSLIHPYIKAIREIQYDNTMNYRFEAWLYDKNYNLIELKNGAVRLDNNTMDTDSVYIDFINDLGFHVENGKYYIAPENFTEIELNKKYNVDIELSDEQSYNSYVVTHVVPFVSVSVPQNHLQGEDMLVTWDVINDYEMKVKVKYTVEHDGGQHRYAYSASVPEENLSEGYFLITGDHFNMTNEAYDAIIRIENFKPGILNTELGEYGQINSIHAVEKKCILNPQN